MIDLRLDIAKVRQAANERGSSLRQLLIDADISRTAFYSLVRRRSILPKTIQKIAEKLNTPVFLLLSGVEVENPADKVSRLRALTDKIVKRYPGVLRENVWHTLILLEEPPIERLRRALRRGRNTVC